MAKKKIVVGIPTEGHTQAEALNCIWLQAFHLGAFQEKNRDEFEFFFCPRGRMYVAMNRETIMQKALDMGADYVFFVDDDMTFQADIFEQLYRHQVDLAAALCFTRNPPHLAVLYKTEKGYDPLLYREYYNTTWIKNYPLGKLVECDAVGFGCVLIDLKTVRKMSQPYFMSSTGTGEDITFCINFKEAGGRIFMDTSTEVGHIGNPIIIDRKTSEKYNDPEMMEKLYGPYEDHRVFDVCFDRPVKDAEKLEVTLGK